VRTCLSQWSRGAAFAVALAASVGACSSDTDTQSTAAPSQKPDATVSIHEFQIAFIGSGDAGDGTLNFKGRSYPIRVAGLGIGGIGVSSLDAVGEVYHLQDIRNFPGTYGRARYGAVAATASSGAMWLKNGAGVVMHLRAKRVGLMLSLGGDAVVVSMK
jgi:hypothetical protein